MKNHVVPPRFLFRWSFEVHKIEKVPSQTKRLLGLSDEYELPALGELEQQSSLSQVRMAWNDAGLGLSFEVSGRTKPPEFVEDNWRLSDGIRVWIDTRNTQTVHRATKYCHHFILLPVGGGPRHDKPFVRSLPVARAREETALPNADLVQTQAEVTSTSYWMDIWFPSSVLLGFDPLIHRKIGFHYVIHDSEQGDQALAVGSEFPVDSDPSLWQTIEFAEH